MSGDVPAPLGAFEQMRRWRGHAVAWGPAGQWSAAFGDGGTVLDELSALIASGRRRTADRYPAKAEAFTVTLGCVPWFDSLPIAEAIIDAGPHCIVVDKSCTRAWAVQRLLANDNGVANYLIPDLRFTAPAGPDGSPPVIGPGSPSPEEEGHALEPVRVVGWKKVGNKSVPILHTKLAVICAAWRWETDFGGYDDYLTPLVAWWGSANWTRSGRRHLELGAWTTDDAMCEASLRFLVDLIRFSEQPTSDRVSPEPDLVDAEWDDEAFAEYYAEYYRAEGLESFAEREPDLDDLPGIGDRERGFDEGDPDTTP